MEYMKLHAEEIDYRLMDDLSEHDVATIEISVPGATITVMGETKDQNGGLIVERAHVSVVPPNARVLTRKSMGVIADRIMKDLGYDHIIIQGAARTTGTRPGHTPRDLRFP
jgi:hypothetical protein